MGPQILSFQVRDLQTCLNLTNCMVRRTSSGHTHLHGCMSNCVPLISGAYYCCCWCCSWNVIHSASEMQSQSPPNYTTFPFVYDCWLSRSQTCHMSWIETCKSKLTYQHSSARQTDRQYCAISFALNQEVVFMCVHSSKLHICTDGDMQLSYSCIPGKNMRHTDCMMKNVLVT
jgi:hypothetical protein